MNTSNEDKSHNPITAGKLFGRELIVMLLITHLYQIWQINGFMMSNNSTRHINVNTDILLSSKVAQ